MSLNVRSICRLVTFGKYDGGIIVVGLSILQYRECHCKQRTQNHTGGLHDHFTLNTLPPDGGPELHSRFRGPVLAVTHC